MKGKKIYNTKQRALILSSIEEFGEDHFTAADVTEKLTKKGIIVGQATVYRMIDRLEESGKIRKYIIDGTTAACYQNIMPLKDKKCNEHFHMKCESCSKLIHIECEEMNKISAHIKDRHEFVVDSSKTVFYGVCKDCAKK